jgi:hypothetical protein
VTCLQAASDNTNQIFVVENHGLKPFIIFPTTQSRDSNDGGSVQIEEEDTTSATGKRLVVRGNLLWANSFKEQSHFIVGRQVKWGISSVEWMHVTLTHLLNTLLVVAFSVFSLVFRLLPEIVKN